MKILISPGLLTNLRPNLIVKEAQKNSTLLYSVAGFEVNNNSPLKIKAHLYGLIQLNGISMRSIDCRRVSTALLDLSFILHW